MYINLLKRISAEYRNIIQQNPAYFLSNFTIDKCKKTIKNVGVLHKNDTKMLKYRLKIAKMGGNINIKKMIDKIIMTKK